MRLLVLISALTVFVAGQAAAQDGSTAYNDSQLALGAAGAYDGSKLMTTPQPPPSDFARDCHRVVADGYWQGRWAHVGGVMCYNAYGEGSVHPNTIHLLYYYPDGPAAPAPQFAPSAAPLQTLPPGQRGGFDARDALGILGAIGLTFAIANGGGGC